MIVLGLGYKLPRGVYHSYAIVISVESLQRALGGLGPFQYALVRNENNSVPNTNWPLFDHRPLIAGGTPL